MKDHCLYILFLVAVLSFAACKKTEIKEPEYGPDSIQAFLPETKTSFSDEGTFSWEAGDALSVADGSGTLPGRPKPGSRAPIPTERRVRLPFPLPVRTA